MSSPNNAAAIPASPIEEKENDDSSHPDTSGAPVLNESQPPVPNGSQPPVDKKTRQTFRLRLLAFFLIEAGFIALAAVCLAKPVPLNLPLHLSDAEVKGGFTVIFIIWQTLAVFAGGHIFVDAFSREWSVQLAQVWPHTTDSVSTITSGLLDRTVYLLTKKASGTFKLAFLASLSFMAFTQLAPGTISAGTTLIDLPVTAQIGRLVSSVSAGGEQAFLTTQNRADLVLRLELIEHSPFGFQMPPNMLTAVPMVNLGNLNGTLEYDSDIVEFQHDCHWEAPQFFSNSGQVLASAAGQVWSNSLVTGQGNTASSITPMSLLNFSIMENVSTSAFFFVGGNGTFHNSKVTPPTSFAIDLGTLPATFVSQGVGVTVGGGQFIGPLATVLVCDPQLKISGGRVRVSQAGTLDVISSGGPSIGNIPPSAANLIFTNALQIALIELEPLEQFNIVNNVASIMFMQNSSVDWNTAQNIRPLDLASINKNVDTFMLSAAKAFIDGYRKNGTSTATTFDLEPMPATGQEQRLALTTSKGLFITAVVLIVIAFILLSALCWLVLTENRHPFDLHSVFSIYSAIGPDDGKRTSLLVPPQPA